MGVESWTDQCIIAMNIDFLDTTSSEQLNSFEFRKLLIGLTTLAMKRTSGAAYLAARDKELQPAAKQKPGWAARGFGDFLREAAPRKPLFDPLLSSPCGGGSIVAKVTTDDQGNEKAAMPKCSWWQFSSNGPPVIIDGNTIDLTDMKNVPLVALIAQLAARETINDASSNQGYTTAKGPSPWTAKVLEGTTELIRLRRPEGLRSTGVWLIATLQKDGDSWKADALDELYPEKRLEAVLMLRFKDYVKEEVEEKVEDPMEATRRMLAEAMA